MLYLNLGMSLSCFICYEISPTSIISEYILLHFTLCWEIPDSRPNMKAGPGVIVRTALPPPPPLSLVESSRSTLRLTRAARLCFPQQSMGGIAGRRRNQFVWAGAALNNNGGQQSFRVSAGLMDLVPRREGQSEAGQTDGQVDGPSVWHN